MITDWDFLSSGRKCDTSSQSPANDCFQQTSLWIHAHQILWLDSCWWFQTSLLVFSSILSFLTILSKYDFHSTNKNICPDLGWMHKHISRYICLFLYMVCLSFEQFDDITGNIFFVALSSCGYNWRTTRWYSMGNR